MLAALVFTIASLHLNDSREYNQINPGIGVERSIGAGHVGMGGYINSSGRLSVYGVVGAEKKLGKVALGVEGGVVTGYKVPVLPLAFPYIRLGPIKLNVLPSRRPILGFQLRLRF